MDDAATLRFIRYRMRQLRRRKRLAASRFMWLLKDVTGVTGELDLQLYIEEGWEVVDVRVISVTPNSLRLFILFAMREE